MKHPRNGFRFLGASRLRHRAWNSIAAVSAVLCIGAVWMRGCSEMVSYQWSREHTDSGGLTFSIGRIMSKPGLTVTAARMVVRKAWLVWKAFISDPM